MKYKVKCPTCEAVSILDREPGAYFYIAKAGCTHRKEVFNTVKKFDSMIKLEARIRGKEKKLDALENECITLNSIHQRLKVHLSGRIREI